MRARFEYGFCFSLFNWRVGDFTRKGLLHDFKGGGAPQRYRFFAEELVRKWTATTRLDLNAGLVIVPAPPKKSRAEDHAVLFAFEIARQLGAPVYNGLLRSNCESQKKRKRHERKNIRLYLDRALSEALQKRSVVFVDDVITTGATSQAAYNVLQPRQGFEVLTLAARPSLQNEVKVAITSDA